MSIKKVKIVLAAIMIFHLAGCDSGPNMSGRYITKDVCGIATIKDFIDLSSMIRCGSNPAVLSLHLDQDGKEITGYALLNNAISKTEGTGYATDENQLKLDIESGFVDEQNFLHFTLVYRTDLDANLGASLGIVEAGVSGDVINVKFVSKTLSPIDENTDRFLVQSKVDIGGIGGVFLEALTKVGQSSFSGSGLRNYDPDGGQIISWFMKISDDETHSVYDELIQVTEKFAKQDFSKAIAEEDVDLAKQSLQTLINQINIRNP